MKLDLDISEVILQNCIVWIQREISQAIQQTAKTRPVVLLTGARQTGKSSLLEKIFPHYNYVSLDWPDKASSARENSSWFLERHKAPLIIDEIQYAPELLRFLKIEVDRKRKRFGQYILTGSQKFSLMKSVSESLAGRIAILECHSLSAREIFKHKKQKLTAQKTLKWIVHGGYPEVQAQKLKPERFYADYLATYLERDVRQFLNVKNLSVFNKFMRLLSLRSAQVLSMNSLSNAVGVSLHTIKSWVSVLEANNIIYLLKPFYNNYGKRLLKSPKLYFLDTGLLCFLSGIYNEEALASSSLMGAFFESFCLGQLIRNFHNKALPENLYYFRDSQGIEVDFILPEGKKLYLYESKWNFRREGLPENIVKFQQLAGKQAVKMSKIITGTGALEMIGRNSWLTNTVEL